MKLKNLHIDSYRHLENIIFDFSYPEGHAKAGKPLEKICIIGQSATGKTSILESIKDSFLKLTDVETIQDRYFTRHYQLNFKGSLEFITVDGSLKMAEDKISKNGKDYINPTSGVSGSVGSIVIEGLKLVYLSSDIISKEAVSIFNQNPVNISIDELSKKTAIFFKSYDNKSYLYQFDQNIDEQAWYSLLSDILDYRKKFTQLASQLINKGAIGDIEKLNNEFKKWAKNNKHPLAGFANYFNPILKRLNLEVDLVNTEFSIPIKSKINDDVIPISSLSTGTKGLLLSMFPLYELDTNDAIILIDEPERSLFPDMQIDLIDNYQKTASNAQIIVATHSPFIAASFEPEERFILYYDENGKVAVRRGKSPIGDDPNDILKNDFNVDYYNKFGQDAYKRYVSLKEQMANEADPQKKRHLLKKVTNLGDEYKF